MTDEYEYLYILWYPLTFTGKAKIMKIKLHKDDIEFARRNMNRSKYPAFTNYWHAYAALLKLKGKDHADAPQP